MTLPSQDTKLPVDALREINAICNRFEEAWRRGERPMLAKFAASWSGPGQERLLQELLLLDIDYRRRLGETPVAEDYMRLMAQFQRVLAGVFGGSLPETRIEDPAEQESVDGNPSNVKSTKAGQTKSAQETASSDPNIGRVIGNFEIVAWLGGGGMGSVYRARHTLIPIERAIKVLQPALVGHPDAVRRFLREAQAAIDALNHGNIVKAFDVGSDGKEVYLVMELVAGEDLGKRVGRGGPLPPEKGAELIEHAANGLAVAHAAGFVHRDIKPANLMLTTDGVLKILDLGLIRLLEDPDVPHERTAESTHSASVAPMSLFASQLTDGRALLGTLAYMAPEQARSPRDADGRSDIYSLGCTLYFLLTGQHPIQGSTPHEILEKHQRAEFQKPRELRPEIPPSLEAIVLRMMACRPEDRYANAGQVARSLRSWRLQDSLTKLETPTKPLQYETAEELGEILQQLKIVTPEELRDGERRSQWARSTTLAVHTGPRTADGMLEALQSFRRSILTPFQAGCIARGDADLLRLPRHVLRDRIGQGWKGEVFGAWNIETDPRTQEVVRTFSPEALRGMSGDHAKRLQVFLERAGQIAAVKHPVFPQVLAFDSIANRLHERLAYLATEYVTGTAVADLVQQPRWQTERERIDWAVSVVSQASSALAVAHAHGVLHLDIHDKSLMTSPQGEVYLIDLGIAQLIIPAPIQTTMTVHSMRFQERLERVRKPRIHVTYDVGQERETPQQGNLLDEILGNAGERLPDSTPVGTPAVMPPEQWLERSDISPVVDIYNLGCVLCYLVTGHYPFEGDSLVKIMQAHLTLPPEKSKTVRQLPRSLRKVVEQMLAKKPQDRIRSASELATELERVRSSHRAKKWFR